METFPLYYGYPETMPGMEVGKSYCSPSGLGKQSDRKVGNWIQN